MSRIPRSFAAWFIMFSLLLNGLLPPLAHAAATARLAPMAICSTPAGKSEAPANPASSHLHCAYCCIGADGPPLPSAALNSPIHIAIGFKSPQPAAIAPRRASIAGIAQPCAPPAGV